MRGDGQLAAASQFFSEDRPQQRNTAGSTPSTMRSGNRQDVSVHIEKHSNERRGPAERNLDAESSMATKLAGLAFIYTQSTGPPADQVIVTPCITWATYQRRRQKEVDSTTHRTIRHYQSLLMRNSPRAWQGSDES
ncbi:hypothetical protein DM02DRAFT_726075 [Periconia macrospinosa]|uniref:Uncharacterized protein n=1 Tax=Periconia macrospinosa TaxID=97972 RepID=A0A2V1E0T6_9PLEO|nr:hypothetical protein DM02DRAFT_726075 [Periconia macrospinosa]